MQIFFPPLRMRPVAINFIESLCKVNQNCVSLALFVQQCYPIVDCEDQLCSAQSSRLKAASIWVIHSHQLRRAISWWTSIIVSQYKMEKKKKLAMSQTYSSQIHSRLQREMQYSKSVNCRRVKVYILFIFIHLQPVGGIYIYLLQKGKT